VPKDRVSITNKVLDVLLKASIAAAQNRPQSSLALKERHISDVVSIDPGHPTPSSR
jgi:hypothetical protein